MLVGNSNVLTQDISSLALPTQVVTYPDSWGRYKEELRVEFEAFIFKVERCLLHPEDGSSSFL
jgi:hypothetical protein